MQQQDNVGYGKGSLLIAGVIGFGIAMACMHFGPMVLPVLECGLSSSENPPPQYTESEQPTEPVKPPQKITTGKQKAPLHVQATASKTKTTEAIREEHQAGSAPPTVGATMAHGNEERATATPTLHPQKDSSHKSQPVIEEVNPKMPAVPAQCKAKDDVTCSKAVPQDTSIPERPKRDKQRTLTPQSGQAKPNRWKTIYRKLSQKMADVFDPNDLGIDLLSESLISLSDKKAILSMRGVSDKEKMDRLFSKISMATDETYEVFKNMLEKNWGEEHLHPYNHILQEMIKMEGEYHPSTNSKAGRTDSILTQVHEIHEEIHHSPETLGIPIEEDDQVLIHLSKYFTIEEKVHELAACLLKRIPPHGPRFVEGRRNLKWQLVALSALREWASKTVSPTGQEIMDCLLDMKEGTVVREFRTRLLKQ